MCNTLILNDATGDIVWSRNGSFADITVDISAYDSIAIQFEASSNATTNASAALRGIAISR